MPLVGTGKVGELHIAMAGQWKGHPAGEFEFTEAVFDEMIAAFEQQKTPLLIDYEHGAPEGDTRAAGWIHGLEKRRGPNGEVELWAKPVEWTDKAAGMIRAGEYRFCSPWFAKSTTDRVSGERTGPRLLNVALTNLPFLDGQSPIRLSFVCAISPAEPAGNPSPQPAAAPSPEQAAQQEAQALSEQLTAAIDALAQTLGVNRAAVVAAINDHTDAIAGLLRQQLDTDGMPQERPMADKEKPAADADKAKADEIEATARQNDVTIALSQVQALAEKVAKIEEEREAERAALKAAKDAENAKRVKDMIACGALLDTEEESALWLLSTDASRFEQIFGHRKGTAKPVPIGVSQAGTEQVDPAKATPTDLLPEEVGTFEFLCRSWPAEKALKKVIEYRNKRSAKGGAAKVG